MRAGVCTVGVTLRLVVPELGPCHEWNGQRNPAGYGIRWHKEKKWLAHRAKYLIDGRVV